MLWEKGRDGLHKRKPHLELGTKRHPRVLDAIEGDVMENEIFQLLSRKQRIGESLEPFHAVLSGLAAR